MKGVVCAVRKNSAENIYAAAHMVHAMMDSLECIRRFRYTNGGSEGAGVIMKEGLSVRGLTTAASIWITAAIGILVGIGFYFPVGLAAAFTLGTLSAFPWFENKIPSQQYAQFTVKFARESAMPETELLGVHWRLIAFSEMISEEPILSPFVYGMR